MLKNHNTRLDAVLEFSVSEDELFQEADGPWPRR